MDGKPGGPKPPFEDYLRSFKEYVLSSRSIDVFARLMYDEDPDRKIQAVLTTDGWVVIGPVDRPFPFTIDPGLQ